MEDNHWENIHALAKAIVTNGDDAWAPFWLALRPNLERWVRQPQFLGRVSNREDYCSDIVLITWEKLQQNDYNKLRVYFRRQEEDGAAPSGNRFKAWIRRVFKNIGIDYMRSLPEFVRSGRSRSGAEAPQSSEPAQDEPSEHYWRIVKTLTTANIAVRDPVTMQTTAHRMLDFLDTSIPTRQLVAVDLYHARMSIEDIASQLGLSDTDEAERVINRSLDRIKYREAVELWSQGFSDEEIARRLELQNARHAYRIINAAKELLKRHFRM